MNKGYLLHAWIPEDQAVMLRGLSAARDQPVSATVRMAITAYLRAERGEESAASVQSGGSNDHDRRE